MPVVGQSSNFPAVAFALAGRVAAPSLPQPNCIDIEARSTPPPPPPYGTMRLYLDAQTGQLVAMGSDGSKQILALLV